MAELSRARARWRRNNRLVNRRSSLMANLLKEAKRGADLPRVLDGFVMTSERYDHRNFSRTEDGTMPPLMYVVEIRKRGDEGSYFAQFTEDEMIQITAEWFAMM